MGDDSFLIRVAYGRFQKSSPMGKTLAERHLQPLTFHDHARLRPDPAHFLWHRGKHRI